MILQLPVPLRAILLGLSSPPRPRLFILPLLFRAQNIVARQWTTFSCELATLAFVVLLIACSERDSWAEYAAERDCKTYDGVVWKCLEPTPSWWIREKR
jgi:hypothetical protein